MGHECYATPKCSDSFYCGESFVVANSTCAYACPDGSDDSCPGDMSCFAQTNCENSPPTIAQDDIINVGSSYCGLNYSDAATSCSIPCPSGSSAECASLGFDYSCFANTPCDDSDTYYCGTSWSHAASNCLFPCPTGDNSDCPDNTSCFPYTSCNVTESFMCGSSFDDASFCERPCPSGSSSECPFGESCFTHTTCTATTKTTVDPTVLPAEPNIPGDTTSYFCGNSLEDASASCEYPCPSVSSCNFLLSLSFCQLSTHVGDSEQGLSNECPENLSCFAFTTCADKDSYFCGDNFIDASSNCSLPCESGLSSQCPDDLSCFAFTTCDTDQVVWDSAYCGATFEDASSDCTKPCTSSDNCEVGEACFPFATCYNSDTDFGPESLPESFYCGSTFEEASMTCSQPCPSGTHAECPDSQFCFPNTPCQDRKSYFCGISWNDAATSCLIPCPR